MGNNVYYILQTSVEQAATVIFQIILEATDVEMCSRLVSYVLINFRNLHFIDSFSSFFLFFCCDFFLSLNTLLRF